MKPVYVNPEIARILGPSLGKQGAFQAYSGTDIKAYIYLPLITKSTLSGKNLPKAKLFGELQTISISSTRSVSPIRVFGRSSPIGYTRGARTFAGTLVFASVNQDIFEDLYDESIEESSNAASTSLTSDQLPPFSIIITAANEKGAAAVHAVHGITLVNYGTTYSIDDLYTEVTYSYVATDVMPLTSVSASTLRSKQENERPKYSYPDISTHIQNSLKKAYGTQEDMVENARQYLESQNAYYRGVDRLEEDVRNSLKDTLR